MIVRAAHMLLLLWYFAAWYTYKGGKIHLQDRSTNVVQTMLNVRIGGSAPHITCIYIIVSPLVHTVRASP